VANSKSSKKRKQAQRRQRAQHRQTHDVAKARERDRHRQHLPKVGTPEDRAYIHERGVEDIVDFGLTKAKRGPLNWVIALAVVVLLAAMVGYFLFL
jgi:hypothetical protein